MRNFVSPARRGGYRRVGFLVGSEAVVLVEGGRARLSSKNSHQARSIFREPAKIPPHTHGQERRVGCGWCALFWLRFFDCGVKICSATCWTLVNSTANATRVPHHMPKSKTNRRQRSTLKPKLLSFASATGTGKGALGWSRPIPPKVVDKFLSEVGLLLDIVKLHAHFYHCCHYSWPQRLRVPALGCLGQRHEKANRNSRDKAEPTYSGGHHGAKHHAHIFTDITNYRIPCSSSR